MDNEIKVRFVLLGFEQDPGAVTDLLQIEPTETWQLGEPMLPSPVRVHKENGWALSAQRDSTTGVGDQVNDLLDRLEKARDSLNSLVGTYREFSCVIFAYDGVPEIHFSSDTLKRISNLGASIDVDLYCMEDREESELTHPRPPDA